MSYSYYETYITSLRAFSGMGFPYGADEDAAFIITWLELHKLNGIKKLAKIIDNLDKKFNGHFNLKDVKSKKKIDLKNCSLLMKGPNLFDYLYNRAKNNKFNEVIIENCIDPIFSIPLIVKISKKNINMSAYWLDKNLTKIVNIKENNITIGTSKKNLKLKKNQLIIKFHTDKKRINENSIKKFQIINNKIEQRRLKKSLNPLKKDWDLISLIANRTFVPESEQSRNKGAGGGDAND